MNISNPVKCIPLQTRIIKLLLDHSQDRFRLVKGVVQHLRVQSNRMRLERTLHVRALVAAELFEFRVAGPWTDGDLLYASDTARQTFKLLQVLGEATEVDK